MNENLDPDNVDVSDPLDSFCPPDDFAPLDPLPNF
jgi:hypothetical protein